MALSSPTLAALIFDLHPLRMAQALDAIVSIPPKLANALKSSFTSFISPYPSGLAIMTASLRSLSILF